jgi:Tol biopolymer transport system component
MLNGITSGSSGQSGAVVLNADGSAIRLVKWGTAAFAPDGRTAVYSVPGGGLCLVGADGSAPQLLAWDMAEPMDGPPAWSPDGTTIAWLDFVEDSPVYGHHAYGLSFIGADGTGLRQLALHLEGIEEGGHALSWSPDGTRLVFWLPIPAPPPGNEIPVGYLGVGGEIWLVNADGSELHRVTTGAEDRWPAWSPSGDRIAFVHDGRLYTMASDGSDQVPVGDIEVDGSIAWNPAH